MTKTFGAQDHQKRREIVHGWEINITSYKLLDRYLCKVDNVSPGAVIARGEGPTRDEAEADALGNARRRLQLTRVLVDTRRSLDEIHDGAPEAMRAGIQDLRGRLKAVEAQEA